MAEDRKIAERIGRAVADGLDEDPSPEHMCARVLTMAAGFAAGLGDTPMMCEGHFVEAARRAYRLARQPPVVVCERCHQRNRLRHGPSTAGKPVCGACKAPILPGMMAFLDQEDTSDIDTTPPVTN